MVHLFNLIHAVLFTGNHRRTFLEDVSENFLLFFYSSKLAFDFFEML